MPRFILFCGLLLTFMAGCRPTQVTTERILKDSIIVREVPREITIPPAAVASPSVNIDSLARAIQAGIKPEVINRTMIRHDTASGMQARLILDELGNLTALCEQQEKVIEYLEKEVTHWKSEFEKQIMPSPRNFLQRIGDFAEWIIIALLLITLIRLLIRN